jgi:hypothetical protein
MSEIWRPVVGYEDYYSVSSLGRVRRDKGGRGASAGRILRQSTSDGYRYVQLCRKDIKRKLAVHFLVTSAFLGPKPRGKFPNHKNLDRGDNKVGNLEWLTRKQNAQHALANGRTNGRPMYGEQNGRAVLTERQIEHIRRLKSIVGQRVLAELLGVSKSLIQKIHQGKLWPADLRVREFPDMPQGRQPHYRRRETCP